MNLFLQACGADRPMLLTIDGEDRIFPRPFLVIGRDPRCDFVLDHPGVSRRHVYVQMIEGHIFCCDLGSRSGIRWDDGRSARSGWLGPDRGIRIGPYSVRLPARGPADRPAAGMLPDRPGPLESLFPGTPILAETTLESPQGVVKRDGTTVNRIGRVLSLAGRAPDCEPYLSDPSVSWLHCSLVRTPLGTWVVDLVGRGGIAVNGVGVRFARLADGDEIGVGYHLVRVRLNDRSRIPGRGEGFPARPKALTFAPSAGPPGRDAHAQADPGYGPATWPAVIPQPPTSSLPVAQASRPTPLAPLVESGTTLAEQLPAGVALTNDSLMWVMNQFGQQQRQMLEQFFQTMMTMFQMSGSMHREEQESIRRELGQLCKISEELAEIRSEMAALRPAPEGPARPSASSAPAQATKGEAHARPPDGRGRGPSTGAPAQAAPQGDFYAWLSGRMETLQGEQQSRWQNLMNQMLGRQHGGATP